AELSLAGGLHGMWGGWSMTLQALTVATDIRGRLAGSVIAALTLASIGSAVFTLPAAAAKAPAESVTDSVRSGPFGSAHAGQVPTNNTGPSNDDIWGVATVPGAAAANDNVWTAGDYTDGSNVEHVEAALWATPGAWAYQHPANISGGNNVLLGVTAITATNVW